MTEKQPIDAPLLGDWARSPGPVEQFAQPRVTRGRSRRTLRILLLTITGWLLIHSLFAAHRFCNRNDMHKPASSPDSKWILLEKNSTKVPLEIHIMSKCPDAKDCLEKLVVPAMAQVHEKVDFKMSFIGRLDPHSDAVSCMHGPPECLGNMILLCASKLYPEPKIHLGYANCMLSDFRNIPGRDLVEGCAMEHGIDFKKLNDCISDEGEGVDLLRKSVERSADGNVTKSCTVRLDGEIRCIRDAGEWKDCEGGSSVEDLVKDIEKLYENGGS